MFPAIMLHGSYDFSIMIFNFLTTLGADGGEENDDNLISFFYGICAFIFSIGFVIGGALYYSRESKAQRTRLEQLDGARNFVAVST